MKKLVKKAFYTGIGLSAVAVEKIQGAVNNFLEQNQQNEQAGKKIVSEWTDEAKAKKEELEKSAKKVFNKTMKQLNLTTQHEVDKLNDKLTALEGKLQA